jgi:adenylate kinase family enzyme
VIYLLCGVPGSGKTWVAQQLNNFVWVPHDKYKVDEYHEKILEEAKKTENTMDGDLQHLIQQSFYALISIVSYLRCPSSVTFVKQSIDTLNTQVAKIIEKDLWHEKELIRLEKRIDDIEYKQTRGE